MLASQYLVVTNHSAKDVKDDLIDHADLSRGDRLLVNDLDSGDWSGTRVGVRHSPNVA